jgi:hypothetical protein
MDLEAELTQSVCCNTGGAVFLETEFRMHVKIAPQCDHVRKQFVGKAIRTSHAGYNSGRDFCRKRSITWHTIQDP